MMSITVVAKRFWNCTARAPRTLALPICALRSPKARARCTHSAVSVASVPWIAECRSRPASSCGDRAEANSSRGSIPNRRRIRLAVLLKNLIRWAVAVANPRIKGTTTAAVCRGCAMAKFLGTSSLKIIVSEVARTRAITSDRPPAADPTPQPVNGPATRVAIVGCARKPIPRLVTVIPS